MKRTRERLFVSAAWVVAVIFVGVMGCAGHKDAETASQTAGPEPVASASAPEAAAPLGTSPAASAPALNVEADKALQTTRAITSVTVEDTADGALITVKGSGPLTYTAVKSPFYQGIDLYFPETSAAGVPKEPGVKSELVRRVGITQANGGSRPSVKVEIGLLQDAAFTPRQEGNNLVVALKALGAAPETAPAQPSALKSETAAAPPPEPKASSGKAAPAKAAAPVARAAAPRTYKAGGEAYLQRARLKQVDFITEDRGRSVVKVSTTSPVDYTLEKAGARRLLLKLPGVFIPKEQQRPLITTRFESAADRIAPIMRRDGVATVSIELREMVPYRVDRDKDTILIHLDASRVPPRPLSDAGLPDWEAVLQDSAPDSDVAGGEDQAKAQAAGSMDIFDTSRSSDAPMHFKGERIALDFFKTDIKNVFRILKEVSGLNFAIDRDVEGEVTLSLDKPVPWDQVLFLILQMNNLEAVKVGDIIRIAPRATLDEARKAELEKVEAETKKKQMEQASAVVSEFHKKSQAPERLTYIPINYAKCKEVTEHLQSIMEDKPILSQDGMRVETTQVKRFTNVRCDERTNTILIRDSDDDITAAQDMVSNLDKPTPQVMIEARIVEATTTFSREIGVGWDGEAGVQPGDAKAGVGPQRGYDTLGGTYGYNWAVNYPLTSALYGTAGINFTRLMGLSQLTLNATLSAQESRGNVRIVSSPKVLTLDNKKATIKQGLEYPIAKLDDSGNTTIEYHPVDLLLEVTPHVTADRRITLSIHTTKNDLGEVYAGEQSFNTKEATTDLLLNDGDTVVIGGVIKTDRRESMTGVPWFNKLPVVGWLFKTDNDTENREELLIFITPRIVDVER
ncbi:MAG: type IV pilus secretin PilQ [Deltaproteobacteria bacterium]|nr:type IV pilus secretin PilQ [Deltaproteobacteria bacterium]